MPSRVHGPRGYVITCEICERRVAVAPDQGRFKKACPACEPERQRRRSRAYRAANLDKAREWDRRRDQQEQRRLYHLELVRRLRGSTPRMLKPRYLPACLPEVTLGRARTSVTEAPKARTFYAGTCDWCETPFIDRSSQARFCCKPCMNRWWHREGRGKRRIRRREEVRLIRLMVFVADGWVCQLCGEPTVDEVVPHPFAPTVDHAIPLARGGPDVIENLVCAHFICNSRKGAMTLEEWHGRTRSRPEGPRTAPALQPADPG